MLALLDDPIANAICAKSLAAHPRRVNGDGTGDANGGDSSGSSVADGAAADDAASTGMAALQSAASMKKLELVQKTQF